MVFFEAETAGNPEGSPTALVPLTRGAEAP